MSVIWTDLNDVLFGNIQELGGVLQHGEDTTLDVDSPGGIVVVGAHGLDETVLPRHQQRTFLQLTAVHLPNEF
jgi:hypothetical protein